MTKIIIHTKDIQIANKIQNKIAGKISFLDSCCLLEVENIPNLEKLRDEFK